MKNLILIKLGGSVITDKKKPFTARVGVIKRLALEIKNAKLKLKNTDFIISHGSGSFAHIPASKYQIQKGNINRGSLFGFSITSDAAIDINRIVVKQFISVGFKVVSFSPMSFLYSEKDILKSFFLKPLLKSLDLGFTPVIYGDVIFDESKGFTIYSGEKTLDILARKLVKKYKRVKIVQCGDTDGVYDKKGKTISVITSKNIKEIKECISGSDKIDVTGGMLHKVEESLRLAKETKIQTILINGNSSGSLRKAIYGEGISSTLIYF